MGIQTPERLRALYRTYMDEPQIKWKKHIKQVVGIPLLKKPDTDWFHEEPPPIGLEKLPCSLT